MPKFLLEVYRRSLAEDGDQAAQNGGRHTRSTGDGGGDQLITALDREVIEQSDIIMTFLNKSESLSDCNFLKQHHHQQPSRFIHVSLEDRLGEIRAEKRSDEGRTDGGKADKRQVKRHGEREVDDDDGDDPERRNNAGGRS